jgi:hypothetical protein
MSLHTGAAQLNDAMKTLRSKWAELKPRWKDPVRDGFEENQLTPIETHLQAVLRAMDRLAHELDRARADCQ